MTWISTNNKHLNPGISSKFDWLQNVPLTQSRCHDNFSLKILLTCNPTLKRLSWLLIGCQDAAAPFWLSHWSPGDMAHYNFPLLIIISGIHSLATFTMTRSLIISIKPCSILLKFISHTLLHCIYFFTVLPCSYLMHLMTQLHHLRDYFLLIIVRSTWQWPTTASMLCTKLYDLPLFQCFDKFFSSCDIFQNVII